MKTYGYRGTITVFFSILLILFLSPGLYAGGVRQSAGSQGESRYFDRAWDVFCFWGI